MQKDNKTLWVNLFEYFIKIYSFLMVLKKKGFIRTAIDIGLKKEIGNFQYFKEMSKKKSTLLLSQIFLAAFPWWLSLVPGPLKFVDFCQWL